jgi:hypothetical protein
LEEKLLFHIWDAGHLLSPLKTVSGKALQVIYQGQYNTARGPDFHNVILNLDSDTLKGDVEIHINGYDWISHDHHEDHHYNNVILHVVMNAGKEQRTIREDGVAIEILELKGQISEEIQMLLESTDINRETHESTYCDLLSAVDNDTLIATLSLYGMQRFRNKVRRFNSMLLLNSFDQVFYEGVMEALGYDKNKQNMLLLAQSIPINKIKEWVGQGMTVIELVSVFCCSSGLLPRSMKMIPENLSALLKDTYESQRFFSQRIDLDWQMFRIRPASHPIFRLISFANIIHKSAQEGLLSHFLKSVFESENTGENIFKVFYSLFSESVLPGAETLPKLGKALVSTIFVNIFLPVAFLYFDKNNDLENPQKCTEIYGKHPPLQENHITRYMARYLSVSHNSIVNTRAIYQQGLMELFHRFCHYHLCGECASSMI